MNQQSTWETALEKARILYEQQSRDFDAAMSLAEKAGDLEIEVDERALRAFTESTTTVVVRTASTPIRWFNGPRC